MNNHKGFSLISFIFYLLFFLLIILFIYQIITFLVVPSLQSNRIYNNHIAYYLATDVFIKDMRLYNNLCTIKLIANNEIIWNNGINDICWKYDDTKLMRIEGKYNKKWKKKTTSIVAIGLQSAVFIADMFDNDIVGIQLTIVPLTGKAITSYVAINRHELIL